VSGARAATIELRNVLVQDIEIDERGALITSAF